MSQEVSPSSDQIIDEVRQYLDDAGFRFRVLELLKKERNVRHDLNRRANRIEGIISPKCQRDLDLRLSLKTLLRNYGMELSARAEPPETIYTLESAGLVSIAKTERNSLSGMYARKVLLTDVGLGLAEKIVQQDEQEKSTAA